MRIISESVLMLFTQNIEISQCMLNLQLAKVGSFFETLCIYCKAPAAAVVASKLQQQC